VKNGRTIWVYEGCRGASIFRDRSAEWPNGPKIQMAPDTRSARIGSAGPETWRRRPCRANGIFRKEGEYWTVGYAGMPFRLKDTKGLGYLAICYVIRGSNSMCSTWSWNCSQHDDDETGKSGLPREETRKGGIHVTTLGDRVRCSTIKPSSRIGAGSSGCGKNSKKAKELGNVERAEPRNKSRGADKRNLARGRTRRT